MSGAPSTRQLLGLGAVCLAVVMLIYTRDAGRSEDDNAQLIGEAFDRGFEEGKLYGRPSLGCEWSLRPAAPHSVNVGIHECPTYKYHGPSDAIHAEAGKLFDQRAHEGCAGKGIWVQYTKLDHKIIIDKALQQMPAHMLKAGNRLLDIGCGCGLKSMEIMCRHDVAVFGVDISAHAVSWAMKNLPDKRRGLFCQASASNLSYIPDNFFDGAISYGAMYYLMHDCTAFTEILRVLKPGATFYAGWNTEGHPPCKPEDFCIPRSMWTECPGKRRRVEYFTSLDFNGIDKYDASNHYEVFVHVEK